MSRKNKKEQKRKMPLALKIILITLLTIVGLAVAFFAYLMITEYRPDDVEPIKTEYYAGEDGLKTLKKGDTVSLLTWNIGFGALGDNADFFMDGGEMVYTADEDRVWQNLDKIAFDIRWLEKTPDIILMQEVDIDCSRTYGINQVEALSKAFAEENAYCRTFANNFKVEYLPYPWPPIGRVDSGILMFSAYRVDSAERVKLPCPFSWPSSMVNLKRCLTVNRIPVQDANGRELVIVNLHLEAYDDGEGKIEQTKLLKKVLDEERAKGNYVIAGGDFNQSFSNYDVSAYPKYEGTWECGAIDVADFGDEWTFLTDPSLPTCRSLDRVYAGADPKDFQYYVIDGYIVSSNIEVISCKTLDFGFESSDHNPVALEVRLWTETKSGE